MHAEADVLSEKAEATLARLMPHLHRRPDLPGLQRATRQVQRTARRESARVQNLVEAVADDPGLSARLLRLSNSAVYASADAGRNASLDRAVRLLGFTTVQQVAASLPVLDKLPDGPAARLVREDFLRSMLAAQLARELSLDWRDTEAAHLAATFQNLGRILVATHLPDDAHAIRAAVPRSAWPLADREQRAAHRRLGWRYADLGLHVARHWGWPEAVRATLPVAQAWPQQRPTDGAARQRWLGQLANEGADLLLYVDPQHWPAACESLARRVHDATSHDGQSLQQALARTRPRLEPLAELVGLPSSERQHWQAADVVLGGSTDDADADGPDAPAVDTEHPLTAPTASSAGTMAGGTPATLAHRATAAQPPPVPPHTAPDEQVLHQLHHALAARRAVLWRARPDSSLMAMHRVLGEALPASALRDWQVDPERGSDLFSRLCRHGQDSLIQDAHEPRFARHLPAAWKRDVNARSFLVLPLRHQGRAQVQGLLYLDRRDDQPFTLDGDALQLVRTLRDQATMA